MINPIPEALEQRGFIPEESYLDPYCGLLKFSDDLFLEVWEALNGQPRPVKVTIRAEDCYDQSITIFACPSLDEALPIVDALIPVLRLAAKHP